GVDRTRAEPAPDAVVAGADDAVEDQALVLELDHRAGVLVDEAADAVLDAVRPAAVREHLPVEREATVAAVLVERLRDPALRLHGDELPRLKPERRAWRRLPLRPESDVPVQADRPGGLPPHRAGENTQEPADAHVPALNLAQVLPAPIVCRKRLARR